MNAVVIPSLSGGVRWCFWTDIQLGYLDGWGKCCRYAGEWSRTRRPLNAATLLDFTCSFETSFYWQGLLPRYSTSNSKHFLCLILLLCARTHTHTHNAFLCLLEKGYQWLTQETFWLRAALALLFSLILFSFVLVKQIVIIHTTLWHVTRAVLIPLLPLIQYLHFLWDITSFFFLP